MKNQTFVLRTDYTDVLASLSNEEAGLLFKAILNYTAKGAAPDNLSATVAMAFSFIKRDIDYNQEKYDAVCAKRKEAAQQRWQMQKDANTCKPMHNDNEYDSENDSENKINISTVAGQQEESSLFAKDFPTNPSQREEQALQGSAKKLTKLTAKKPLAALRDFAQEVLDNFEPDVQTDEQKRVWFKRNCRCLADIFKFCGKNKEASLATIYACFSRLEKANLKGGYEAVCRNLPQYFGQAKALLNLSLPQADKTGGDRAGGKIKVPPSVEEARAAEVQKAKDNAYAALLAHAQARNLKKMPTRDSVG